MTESPLGRAHGEPAGFGVGTSHRQAEGWNSVLDGWGSFAEMPIAGVWRSGTGGGTLTDRDPWDATALTTIATAGVEDVDQAVEAAAAAQREWVAVLSVERADVMRRAVEVIDAHHADIVRWVVRESGGTLGKVEVEVASTRAVFLEAAAMTHHPAGSILPSDIPGKENRVYRKPVGVVALIGAWDFPLALTARSLAPALASGNAVVVKPSSETPIAGGLMLARILEEAGLPAGLLSVVIGPGSGVGHALAAHPVPRVLSFAGSTATGITLARVTGIKRLLLEMGGNAALVVLDDANIAQAVDSAVFGSFYNAGQGRMIANRLIVDGALFDEFTECFVARTAALQIGDPADPDTFIGPVISRPQLTSVQDKVRRSVGQGARLALGGDPTGPAGLVLPPQVLIGGNHVAAAREEVFGPAITLIRANGEEEALRLANDTAYGLSSAVHTADRERGVRFAHRLKVAITQVNDSPVNLEDRVAYGGEKLSGLGRLGGPWPLDEFTTHHWISVQHTPRSYPV